MSIPSTMVVERVDISVPSGQEADFEAIMRRASTLLASAIGCRGVSLSRCVERPSRYMLQLNWLSINHHQDFTKTANFQTFRELAGPFFSERPTTEHFQPIFTDP